jgi:hypothetical protein
MLNKILSKDKKTLAIKEVDCQQVKIRNEKLLRLFDNLFIDTEQVCPKCNTNHKIKKDGDGYFRCFNHRKRIGHRFKSTKGTFLQGTQFLNNPAKWFALITFYNHGKKNKIKYGLKVNVSRILNIDIKNIKAYWKRFKKIENNKLFKSMSTVFDVKLFGTKVEFYHSEEYFLSQRLTDWLDFAHLNTHISHWIQNNYERDFNSLKNIIQEETQRYTKHGINLNSRFATEILSKAQFLIYYYANLLKKSGKDGELELSNADFEEIAFGFVSFYYRGGRGRRLNHIIPSFKKYVIVVVSLMFVDFVN